MSFGQRFAGVRDLASAVEQGIADGLEDGDLILSLIHIFINSAPGNFASGTIKARSATSPTTTRSPASFIDN